jgi:hypothetical protein
LPYQALIGIIDTDMIWTPKRTMEDVDIDWGICLWQLPNKTYVQNSDGDYLSAGPAKIGDVVVETKMRQAAKACYITDGKPFWLPGFRKITNSEWEDQMERLMEGKIADPVDLYMQNEGSE